MTYVYEDEIDDYLSQGFSVDQLHVLQYGEQRPQEPEFNKDIWERTMKMNEVRRIVRTILKESFSVDKSMAKDTLYILLPKRNKSLESNIEKFLNNATEMSFNNNSEILSNLGVDKYEFGYRVPVGYEENHVLYPIEIYKKAGVDILKKAKEEFGDDIKLVDWSTYSKWLNYNSPLSEAVTFDNNKTFIPPPNVAQRAQEALNAVSNNKQVQTGLNAGSGMSKAKELASNQTQGHRQMETMKSYFNTNQKEYDAAKAAGGTIQDNGVIQAWELHGGDSGKDWVNQKLDITKQSNLNTKKNLRKAGGAGENKGMGTFDTKMMSTNNYRINK